MYKYKKNIVYKINNLINKNINLNKIFNYQTKKRKYSNKILIKCIIDILKDGISFRSIGNYKEIKWQTIYKFYCKLIRYNIIKIIFDYKNKNTNNNIYITDTTLIQNKLGINDIGYNPQQPKHKTCKNNNNNLLNNNILLGDVGYDSNKFGKLITPKNKRNTKNKIIKKKNQN